MNRAKPSPRASPRPEPACTQSNPYRTGQDWRQSLAQGEIVMKTGAISVSTEMPVISGMLGVSEGAGMSCYSLFSFVFEMTVSM